LTRAFVAVEPPYEWLDALRSGTQGLHVRGGRVMAMQQWHLTLQFLGDDADVDAVVAALDGFSVPGGRVGLGGAGAFPNARRGTVLWVGLSDGADVVARLADGVAERLAPLGYEREARPFHPHITVARCRQPTDLRAQVAALDATDFGSAWEIEGISVYESETRREGARYTPRATIRLPG